MNFISPDLRDRYLRIFPALLVLPLFVFSVIELLEGEALTDLPELCLIISSLIVGTLYWRTSGLHIEWLTIRNKRLKNKADISIAQAARWREEAKGALKTLSSDISQQFTIWGLSPSEKVVALELLKGSSHKEIADLKGNSEKTIRLQASSIYKKSGVEGRAQLAAFFLSSLSLIEKDE